MTKSSASGTAATSASAAVRSGRGGRPRASSRRTLEDAAGELFLEQGYARTTIDQIAQRAGVGRNTFFNYFATKSDLLWLDVDDTLRALPEVLAAVPAGRAPSAALREALLGLAARHPHRGIPLALSQREAIGAEAEFRASGLERFLGVAAVLGTFLAARSGRAPGDPLVRAASSAAVAALVSGAADWALTGVERGALADAVRDAVDPVCRGYALALDAAPAPTR
ncbi:TetR/AcrR family transcriptional regulator [Agromyces mediolanus]|uniref:TetR/AcrR family transcriptional regulator n=1 Tax=Agromyces mediolanus TaxID=41986 RepID=UPI001E3C4D27|nr:TetR/AcrR family transcriptional regulator [Agromyces mediolanus]MCD1570199.1 TetR/AcrR family transcriptional regulator [Agromyces mediolanus]